MRILLAEDDAALVQRLVPLLEQAGYVVHTVADGRQAEEIGQVEDLQAAIVDLGLPGLDGLSVIERWRGNGRSFPVLVLTARGRCTTNWPASMPAPTTTSPSPSRPTNWCCACGR